MTYIANMVFIETPKFTEQASGGLFTDVELTQLQNELIQNPTKGSLIQGSGGLRKIRVTSPNSGKSGGSRVIYYIMRMDTLYFLIAYSKSKKDTLTKQEIAILRNLIEN